MLKSLIADVLHVEWILVLSIFNFVPYNLIPLCSLEARAVFNCLGRK